MWIHIKFNMLSYCTSVAGSDVLKEPNYEVSGGKRFFLCSSRLHNNFKRTFGPLIQWCDPKSHTEYTGVCLRPQEIMFWGSISPLEVRQTWIHWPVYNQKQCCQSDVILAGKLDLKTHFLCPYCYKCLFGVALWATPLLDRPDGPLNVDIWSEVSPQIASVKICHLATLIRYNRVTYRCCHLA